MRTTSRQPFIHLARLGSSAAAGMPFSVMYTGTPSVLANDIDLHIDQTQTFYSQVWALELTTATSLMSQMRARCHVAAHDRLPHHRGLFEHMLSVISAAAVDVLYTDGTVWLRGALWHARL